MKDKISQVLHFDGTILVQIRLEEIPRKFIRRIIKGAITDPNLKHYHTKAPISYNSYRY